MPAVRALLHSARMCILPWALLLPTPALAQGVLGGTLTHAETGRPLACYNVTLHDSTEARVAEAVTRPDGTFEFMAPARQGTYRLRFAAFGFHDVHTEPEVMGPDTDFERQFRLEWAPRDSLAELWEFFASMDPSVAWRDPSHRLPDALRHRLNDFRQETSLIYGVAIDSTGRTVPSSYFLLLATDAEFATLWARAIPMMRFSVPQSFAGPRCSFSLYYTYRGGRRGQYRVPVQWTRGEHPFGRVLVGPP